MTQIIPGERLPPRVRTARSRISEFADELHALIRRYPSFVLTSKGPAPGEIPVFVFHTIEPADFEEQLRYLVSNGYRTLAMAEFLDIMAGRIRGSGREVLLTIDDARSSTWFYALPLLRRHGCHAVTFAITGWTRDAPQVRPNLDSGASVEELAALDMGDKNVCSWSELAAMQTSGHMDVESHTHRHARVFAAPNLLDFLDEGSPASGFSCMASPYLAAHPLPAEADLESYWGAPLLPTRPLTGGGEYFEIPEETVSLLHETYVKERAKGLSGIVLREALHRRIRACLANLPPLRKIDSKTAYRRLLGEIDMARQLLVQRLRVPSVGRTLCVPFTLGSERTVDAARELGIEAVFWGSDAQCRINFAGMDLLRAVRLKNDFIHRLPGNGRRSLADVFRHKASRRLAGSTGY